MANGKTYSVEEVKARGDQIRKLENEIIECFEKLTGEDRSTDREYEDKLGKAADQLVEVIGKDDFFDYALPDTPVNRLASKLALHYFEQRNLADCVDEVNRDLAEGEEPVKREDLLFEAEETYKLVQGLLMYGALGDFWKNGEKGK